jgi:hypothetical protein
VFQKVIELAATDEAGIQPSTEELDDLDELRRFSAELQEPEPLSMTSTV